MRLACTSQCYTICASTTRGGTSTRYVPAPDPVGSLLMLLLLHSGKDYTLLASPVIAHSLARDSFHSDRTFGSERPSLQIISLRIISCYFDYSTLETVRRPGVSSLRSNWIPRRPTKAKGRGHSGRSFAETTHHEQ